MCESCLETQQNMWIKTFLFVCLFGIRVSLRMEVFMFYYFLSVLVSEERNAMI